MTAAAAAAAAADSSVELIFVRNIRLSVKNNDFLFILTDSVECCILTHQDEDTVLEILFTFVSMFVSELCDMIVRKIFQA